MIDEKSRVWATEPEHLIAEERGESVEIPHAEVYDEFFDIPRPDEQVFIS